MTREEAAEIIKDAFPKGEGAPNAALAYQLATALDAIGLLHYAADRDLGAKLGHVGDEQPLQHSRTQPPEQLHEHVAPDGTSLAASYADVSRWAASRKRT